MGMDPADIAGQLGGEDASLAEAAHPIAGAITAQIRGEGGARPSVAGKTPCRAPAAPYPPWLLMQVFGQVIDGRDDFAMHRTGAVIRRLRSWTTLSVGCLSETMSWRWPASWRPSISWAMKVSERRG